MNGQCVKSGFRSAQDANIALIRIRRNPATDRVPVRYYQCPDCRRWHLTSQPERQLSVRN